MATAKRMFRFMGCGELFPIGDEKKIAINGEDAVKEILGI